MDAQMMQLGMFSSMRANKTEALMCILIPIIVKRLYDATDEHSLENITDKVKSFFGFRQRRALRTIESKLYMGNYGRVYDATDMNHVLQRAIAFYLNKTVNMLQKNNGRYELVESLDESVVSKFEIESNESDNDYWYREPEVDISLLQVNALPPVKEWIEIEPGLWFYHDIEEDNERGGGGSGQASMKPSVVTFKLRSYLPDAKTRIDTFVNTAFQVYQDAMIAKKLRDKTRYMYVASTASNAKPSDDKDSKVVAPLFKRYALSEHKTFDSLFFSGKDILIDMLDNFTAKKGKYGVAGFPYKLGFLLHGPPGTGKTSMIKAIAQYTKRHIVNISLANVKTNQDLMDYMLDLRIALPGEDMPIKLKYEQVVFVMEDIDCASEIVHTRESAPARASDEADELNAALIASLSTTINNKPLIFTSLDKLNLSGLLNVLDGVVDTPGRILIMTTNHPEKLDLALIRPGRIDEQILLGPIDATQTKLMIQHYFSTQLQDDQAVEIDRVFKNTKSAITPAEVENLCAKYRSLEDMLSALAREL
ncbi:hypothetical protein THRCLA_07521 [Thraustotheca clavata]|uniref:AAA+ ATPase domain-containing protein n=1 Tax=Thraustotheca clavata TaxID=74557 RepID=A0A1V9ZCX4_9STRA|nr:hypothetical protein THRCLA_07521 [Thraustotheca clavata]